MARRTIVIILLLAGLASAQVVIPLEAWNSGEVSPLFEARTNFVKYDNACRTLQNMLVLTQGPVMRRPGTSFIADANDSTDEMRLISFEFSKSDTYILELADEYMRFYRNGGQILSGGNPFEIAIVYDESELFEIQHSQSANTMYLVHGDHPPQKLTRTGHTSWTIIDYPFVKGPFLPENTTIGTIAASAITGTVTLSAASGATPFDDPGHVGSLWRINHRNAPASINGSFSGDGSSSTLPVGGAWDASTKGTWTGTVSVERSEDGGSTWEQASGASVASVNDDNLDHSDTELEAGVIFRMTMSNHSSGTATFNLSAHEYIHVGIVEITAVASNITATATVITDLISNNQTALWSEGYWSDFRGWPQTVEFHEQRLVFGGSDSYPQTLWFTATGDFNDMEEGTIDDDAFIYELPGQNPMQWMISQDFLMIGTLGEVGRIGTRNIPITPSNPSYKTQSRPGSAYVQAVLAGDAILYIERGGEKVREVVFSLERDSFLAPDLTILAEHIADGGIVDIAYQARPDSVLWCVKSDGTLLSLTYRREEEVIAWSNHVTDGLFESVAVIPGIGEDEIWVVVSRTVDSNDLRYVEQFQPRGWSDQEDAYYVDSGLSFDGGAAVNVTNITQADPAVVTVSVWPTDGDGVNIADGDQVTITNVSGMTEINEGVYTMDDDNVGSLTFSLDDSSGVGNINSTGFTAYTTGGTTQRVEKNFGGLGHLEGEEVTVFADGAFMETADVSSSTIVISQWVNTANIGKEYTSILETMPLVFEDRGGSVAPKNKLISSVEVDVFETLGFFYGRDSSSLSEMPEINSSADPIPVFTGFRHCPFPFGNHQKTVVYIEESRPIPLTVRALYPSVEIVE